jgi:hypothetical protein
MSVDSGSILSVVLRSCTPIADSCRLGFQNSPGADHRSSPSAEVQTDERLGWTELVSDRREIALAARVEYFRDNLEVKIFRSPYGEFPTGHQLQEESWIVDLTSR